MTRALPGRLLDEDGRLLVEVPCLACGYALKSLTLAARCPECGGLVTDSIDAGMLRFAPTRWLERLVSGATWLLVSLAAIVGGAALTLIVGGGLVMFADQFGLTPGVETTVAAVTSLITAAAVFGLRGLGYWLLTTPEPGATEPDQVRVWARFGLMSGLGIEAATELLGPAPVPAIVMSGMQWAGVILTAFGLAALLQHVSRLFARIPRPKLARQTTWVMWGFVPSYAVFIATKDAARVVETVGLDLGGWGVLIVVFAVFAIGPLVVFGAWALVLLLTFRRVVTEAAQASTQLAAPSQASRLARLTGRG